MISSFSYTHNADISETLNKVEVNRKVIDILPTSKQLTEQIVRDSILKSSLFSAKIEGNPLTLSQLKNKHIENNNSVHLLEIQQLNRCYQSILSTNNQAISTKLIQTFHKETLHSIVDHGGKFRHETTAIFDSSGTAIYLTPPPQEIPEHIKNYVTFVAKQPYHPIVTAAVAHLWFEKIHPFVDGNGRVGRLLTFQILKNCHYHFNGMLALEEAIEENREEYYQTLLPNKKDVTPFVSFFVKTIANQSEKLITRLTQPTSNLTLNILSPRRQEILSIITDHHQVSFDFIRRRFISIPVSTLHNDLFYLQKHGFIQKLGVTKGVWYTLKVIE